MEGVFFLNEKIIFSAMANRSPEIKRVSARGHCRDESSLRLSANTHLFGFFSSFGAKAIT